ncbi:GAF and ANTAR domain-containing protein [Arthrobacter sp. SPG23]|uniref:GAF and ANTAR domain-containing protein n=1 Tax=Arthrobacter sp. SPG23 TaxID=1610703 RepID=UPI000696B3AC|nr:GAF and ANTAR domain-containing protein [Arthrobacter sp. SPG23]
MTGTRLGPFLAERLQDLVLESAGVQDFLQELCVFSAGFIGKTTGLPVLCTVTLVRPRRPVASAGSGPGTRLPAEVQQATGLSPSLAALESGATVSVPDARADSRWPRYNRAVLRAGQLSVLALPLQLDPDASASVSFFAPEAGAFDDEAIVICEAFAARAGKAVRLAARIGASRDLNDDLLEALKSRTSINLASGIVMGQSRCSQAEAFAILGKVSSNRNVKLRVVAEDLLRKFDTTPEATHFTG